jgi:parallel beta-helix repeat protein
MHKNILTIVGITFMFLGLGLTPSIAVNAEKKLSILIPTDNTLYVGGSGPGNYTEIQDAIDNASDGDTVFVFSGIYPANIIVNKSIKIIGENRESTIIQEGHNGVTINANEVTLTGFTIRKNGGYWNQCGIYVSSSNSNISDNNVIDNWNGIFLEFSSYLIIHNNKISDNRWHGFRMEYSSNSDITRNYISNNHGFGIYLWESSKSNIIENTIKQNFWDGINLGDYCENNVLFHNNLIDNNLDNAYDKWGNKWDDGYPSGGNFWDDYKGEDNDNDGIGDIPYVIPGEMSIDNYPLMNPYGAPSKPIIKGPTNGKPSEEYNYSVLSFDPDDDNVSYFFDWGDGTTSDWTSFVESGTEIYVSHTWKNKGTYEIKVKAKDIYELESDWSTLEMIVPKNKTYSFDLPNIFQILITLLELI